MSSESTNDRASELILAAAKQSGLLEQVELMLTRYVAADVAHLITDHFGELAGTAPITMDMLCKTFGKATALQ